MIVILLYVWIRRWAKWVKSWILIFYLSRQASCLLVISRVGPEKKNTIVAAHTWTGLNVSFVRFYIFIDLDFVSVGKNGPKKELGQYPVPSVGTVAQITYNIRNDWAKQYSPQENSIFGFLYFFCDEVTCRWPVSSHLELTLGQKQL